MKPSLFPVQISVNLVTVFSIFSVAWCPFVVSLASSGCDRENQLIVDTGNCQKYYKCIRCPDKNDWCQEPKDCPAGKYFNDFSKRCVVSKICPQDRPELPSAPGWSCSRDREISVHPSECTQHYTCVLCTKPSGWCYDITDCGPGKFFDQSKKLCTTVKICPQDRMELPDGAGWQCGAENEKHVMPNNCSSFYSCFSCDTPRKWCYKRQDCSPGQIFDNDEKRCAVGKCSSSPPHLPSNWSCEKENQLNVEPTNCKKFYKCLRCTDNYPLCYESKECSDGEFFDDFNKSCVVSTACPQERPELPSGSGWNCQKAKEMNVHPKDCSQFYTCLRCTKPSGWCYEATKCSPGMYFDQSKRECVKSETCPKDLLELPSTSGWKCTAEDEKNVVPDNCSSFYTCHSCDKPTKWCYTRHECPSGQTFDNVEKSCKEGRCPSYPPVLPDNIKCTKENQLNVDSQNCKKFLKCVPCPDNNPWCYESKECSEGEFFDDFRKGCGDSPVCPQERPELPSSGSGWSCEKDKEMNVHPKDCAQFYTCIRCTKPSGWCYETTKCSHGMFFDQEKRQCVKAETCPEEWMELPSTRGWQCSVQDEKNAVPDDCASFYICSKCDKPSKWCHTRQKCPAGQTFNETADTCLPGRCPSYPPVLPQNMTCTNESQLYVDPGNCQQFFECVRCPDDHPWCYERKQCADGQYFDDFNKTCVVSKACPQQHPELPSGPGWKCEKDKETYVHPTDCTQFYTCIRCTKPSGWCYETTKCGPGMFFDQGKKQCVETKKCPQDLLELPGSGSVPGWKCAAEDEKNVVPDKCSSFYTCHSCDKPSKWCYEPEECPDGKYFDDFNKSCAVSTACPQERPELPSGSGWSCGKEKETNVYPTDCAKFYTCLHCTKPSGWCYETTNCGAGMFFDQEKRQCAETSKCPQDLLELPSSPGWKCTVQDEKNVVPGECSSFYICHSCDKPNNWCYTRQDCPAGQNFDNRGKVCVEGACPTYPPAKPTNFTQCKKEGKLKVHPEDCRKFANCTRCPDNDKLFCLSEYKTCPPEQYYFDDYHKVCVGGNTCPQLRSQLPKGPGFKCTEDKEKGLYPGGCQIYYNCIRCAKGWCYTTGKCDDGWYFDVQKKDCVETNKCPQD